MSREEPDTITRERILDEAESLFGQKGYHGVSIREITRAARCHVGAVNYHFGSKKNLYLSVFRERWMRRSLKMQQCFRDSLAGREPTTPAEVVRALAEAFLEGDISEEERLRHHQLMAREMAKPSEAMDMVAEEITRPFMKELAGMIGPAMPKEIEQERIMLNILSIFAQVLYFNFARSAVSLLTGREYGPEFTALLVDHISGFTLKGLGSPGEEDAS
jgi:AcrR family transcriptional regulator